MMGTLIPFSKLETKTRERVMAAGVEAGIKALPSIAHIRYDDEGSEKLKTFADIVFQAMSAELGRRR